MFYLCVYIYNHVPMQFRKCWLLELELHTSGFEPQYECWELNWGSLQELVLLTTEPSSLQAPEMLFQIERVQAKLVLHACEPSIWEVEAGRSEIQGYLVGQSI